MSIVSGTIGAAMSSSAQGNAADQAQEASMQALLQQRRTDLENRAFYMDLYEKSQDVYNKEMMRAEPFREGGLFGLEMLIGTDNFERQIQPYVTQSQKDLWESPTYNQPGADPGTKRQIDAYTKMQKDIASGEFKPPNLKDLQKKYGKEGGNKMFMAMLEDAEERYGDMLPQGMGLEDIPMGPESWLNNPVPIDKYGRPIDEQTIMQYQQGGTPAQGGPLTGGRKTPATSQSGGQPVAPGGAPVGGGAFGGGGASGFWGSRGGGGNQQGALTSGQGVGGEGNAMYTGQPVGPGGDIINMGPTTPGGNAFAPTGGGGGGQPGAMFSQPGYQGYDMGPEYTMEQFMNDPSTQLALAEMQKGVESGAVARTGTLGPNQMRDLMDRQTDYIYSKYPQMRGQMFGEQLTQKQQNEAEQQNAFNRWMSGTLNPAQALAGMGQTGGAGSSPMPGSPPMAAGGAPYAQAGGNALAGGTAAQGDAWQNAMTGVGNAGLIAGGLALSGAFAPAAAASTTAAMPGVWGAFSSRELKQDIESLDQGDCLDKVCSLRGVGYKWRHNTEDDAGLIAEELEEIIPEAVTMVGGYKGIKPLTMIGYLVESIKQVQSELNDLRRKHDGSSTTA